MSERPPAGGALELTAPAARRRRLALRPSPTDQRLADAGPTLSGVGLDRVLCLECGGTLLAADPVGLAAHDARCTSRGLFPVVADRGPWQRITPAGAS